MSSKKFKVGDIVRVICDRNNGHIYYNDKFIKNTIGIITKDEDKLFAVTFSSEYDSKSTIHYDYRQTIHIDDMVLANEYGGNRKLLLL